MTWHVVLWPCWYTNGCTPTFSSCYISLVSPERFTLTRVLPSFPTKPPCNRYERLSLGVLLWCLWLWSWCRCSPAAVSEVKNDAYVLKRLPVETRRVAWTWEMSRCGRVVLVSVVELLTVMFVLHVTQTSGVNTCMFSLLILFYSVQLSHLQSLYIYNMLSQMWINQLTPDVFIQLLHVKRNSYVNIIWLYIIFIYTCFYSVYPHWHIDFAPNVTLYIETVQQSLRCLQLFAFSISLLIVFSRHRFVFEGRRTEWWISLFV